MKKIMFLYHVKEREYTIIEMIEKQIKSNYSNAVIRSGEFYSSIMDTIQFGPDIIVTIPPRDFYSSNYLTILKIITGAVIISMNTEGFYKFSSDDVALITGYNTYSKELVDYFIMWGPMTKKRLGQRLILDGKLEDMRRIKVTGYAYYELDKMHGRYEMYNKSLSEWFVQYTENILVVTGFMLADCSIKEYHLLGYFGNDKSIRQISPLEIEQAKQSIEADAEFRKRYIEGIIMLARNNPQMGFIVKLHPVEIEQKSKAYDVLQDCPNILLIKRQIPVGVLLGRVNGLIHYNSTCNFEAYIYKVPTIQIYNDNDYMTSYKHDWQYKGDSTYLVHSNQFQEINRIIKDGLKYKRLDGLEKMLFGLFNWKPDKEYKPIEKTAAYIANAHKAQRLKYRDKQVADAMNSEQGKRVRTMLFNSLWDKLSDNKVGVKEICALIKVYRYMFFGKIIHLAQEKIRIERCDRKGFS